MAQRLDGKTIVVGLSGGIACYKAAELVRELVRAGAHGARDDDARRAQQFITPLTLQTLSGHPVATDTFDLTQESEIGHIRLADARRCGRHRAGDRQRHRQDGRRHRRRPAHHRAAGDARAGGAGAGDERQHVGEPASCRPT